MDKNYNKLEETMVTYAELVTVSVHDTAEPFVSLDDKTIPFGYNPIFCDMENILIGNIYVRSGTYERLIHAQKHLQGKHPDLSLFVTYGYRSLEVQTSSFLERLKENTGTFYPNPTALYEEVHRSVAVPTVAGHPTGGAVDIKIQNVKTKAFLDFGAQQYDYSTKDYYVYAPVSEVGKTNRMLLRSCMVDAGFAPFDGEWWHFSYGDREWARYYKKPYAIYDQKTLAEIML